MNKSFSIFTERLVNPKTGKAARKSTDVGEGIFIKKKLINTAVKFLLNHTLLLYLPQWSRKVFLIKKLVDQL